MNSISLGIKNKKCNANIYPARQTQTINQTDYLYTGRSFLPI